MKRLRLMGSFLLLTLTAYGCQTSSSDAAKELNTISSWAATAQMVAEAWMQGSVPEVYAKQTLEKTQHELDNERKTVENQLAQQTPQLPQQLQHLDEAIQQLTIAIDHKDKRAIAQPLHQLEAIQHQLKTLSQKAGQP